MTRSFATLADLSQADMTSGAQASPAASPVSGGVMQAFIVGDDSSENLSGTNSDDTIVANGGNDTISGLDGMDLISGGDGDDVISGGAGDDNIDAGQGNNLIDGGDGNDALGGMGDDTMSGDGGNDTYIVGSLGDVVTETSGQGTDVVLAAVDYLLADNVENLTFQTGGDRVGIGNGLDNIIVGNEGHNQLLGMGGQDSISGDNGNDALSGGSGDDTLSGGDDEDGLNGGDGSDSLTGGLGNDTIVAGSQGDTGYDLAYAGDGNDSLTSTGTGSYFGEGGNDTFASGVTFGSGEQGDGGDGVDTLDNSLITADYGVDLASGMTNYSAIVNEHFTNFENAIMGSGYDTVSGTTGDNSLLGGDGNDLLTGLAGNDRLDGESGADSLNGGTGNDTYVIDNDGDAVTELAGEGVDEVDGSVTVTLIATIENLTLTGTAAIDGTGNDSDNVIYGNGADNSLSGGLGTDSLYAGGGNDTVHGGVGDDVIYGGNGFNVIYGDDGNDYVQTQSDSYNSAYDGGAGRDTIDYSWVFGNYNAVIDLTLGSYVDSFGNETILNFENVLGTQGSETIIGNDSANGLNGYDGNDSLSGLAGDDILNGGNGNDTIDAGITGSDAFDTVDGGDGNDVIYGSGTGSYLGGAGDDYMRADNTFGISETLDGGLDNDTLDTTQWSGGYAVNLATGGTTYGGESFVNFENIKTGDGNDTVTGTSGANQIWTGAGNDSINAGSGNDWLDGGSGADTMAGGLGDDTFVVDNSGEVVNESNGQGTDAILSSVTYTLGATYIEVVTLTGDASIDAKGNTVNNALNGNAGSNKLDGGVGADTLTGGLGADTYVVDNAGDVIVEVVGQGTDTLQTVFTTTLTAALENLILTGATALNGTGNVSDNSLTGNFGSNSLTGLGGNDRLDGGGGADTLVGGLGNDIYVIDNAGDIFTELNNQGTDTLLSSVTIALTNSQSIETLTLTGPAHINASGNASANVLNGNSGNNILNGGSGADTMSGGAGHDIYVIENAGDIVTEALGAGTDTVQSAVTYVLGDNVENLTLAGSAAINGTGNALANTIYGNAGANFLTGGGGADKLYGRGGNDTYIVDNAAMGISELLGGVDAGGVDEVRASVSYSLKDYFENLVLTGTGNINGVGNGLANHVTGNSGNNLLTGGGGNDTLLGGFGADQFVFGAGSGIDTVGDFSGLQNDRINVHALAHGVVNGGGISFSQSGLDTIVNLGGGNMVTVIGALVADVQSHMVW